MTANFWMDILGTMSFFLIGSAVGYAFGERHEALRWVAAARPFKRVNGKRLYGPIYSRGEMYWVGRDEDACLRCAPPPSFDPNDSIDMRH
jgi:hypothetical protein